MHTPVWLITGSSSGIGHALADAVLARGHRAVLAARSTEPLHALAERYPDQALVVGFDITRPDHITNIIRQAEARFGGIDVLVNNAGVGYLAAIEEGEEENVRWLFETNFFGPAALIRAALPGLRARKAGTVVNISSMAGFVSYAGMGYYAATKFALTGLTEALWQEIEPLGLSVILVEPGGFRTGITSRNRGGVTIPAYAETAGAFRDMIATAGEEVYQGDPVRAAQAILAAVTAEQKPHRLVLGSDAIAALSGKVEALKEEYALARASAHLTDFPVAARI